MSVVVVLVGAEFGQSSPNRQVVHSLPCLAQRHDVHGLDTHLQHRGVHPARVLCASLGGICVFIFHPSDIYFLVRIYLTVNIKNLTLKSNSNYL